MVDGTERWSRIAPHADIATPLRCDDRSLAYVDGGALRLVDIATGADVGSTTLTADPQEEVARVLALSGQTVVVRSSDAVRGYRAHAGLEQLWTVPCRRCDSEVQAGPAGDGVVLVTDLAAQHHAPIAGGGGPTVDLQGLGQVVLGDGTLLAWGRAGVIVADTADLAQPAHLDVDAVRQAAVGATHVVVSTVDEVRAYPL